jgi:hypothetical protein
MSELLSLYPEDAKGSGWGESRTVTRQAKRAVRERCEWIGPPVDGTTTTATFADETQGAAEGERRSFVQRERRLSQSLVAFSAKNF